MEKSEEREAWIGVDLDGTLAHYEEFEGRDVIGDPIPAMIKKVRHLIHQGRKFKIFTARAEFLDLIPVIQDWCEAAGIGRPEVTNVKDFSMLELWDDRARQVKLNTGEFVDEA